MTHSHPIRVLIVDDHAMVRSGLRMFLLAFDDLEMAGEAANGSDAVRLVEQLQPDVVLMDLIMPGQDGMLTTQIIKKRFPKVQVLALTSFADPSLMQEAVHVGAIGFLLKSVSAADLAAAIRSAYAGTATFSPEVAQALLQNAARPAPPTVELTEREAEVLALMVNGKSNAQIASQLVISLSTVKYHVSSVLSKLGVKSRAEAVAFATRNHLME